MVRIWLPMVVHSAPLMTPMFFTDKIVKNRSLSARSFQFLLFMARRRDGLERGKPVGQIGLLYQTQGESKRKQPLWCESRCGGGGRFLVEAVRDGAGWEAKLVVRDIVRDRRPRWFRAKVGVARLHAGPCTVNGWYVP